MVETVSLAWSESFLQMSVSLVWGFRRESERLTQDSNTFVTHAATPHSLKLFPGTYSIGVWILFSKKSISVSLKRSVTGSLKNKKCVSVSFSHEYVRDLLRSRLYS